MTLIGYSVRLAFPRRHDGIELAALLDQFDPAITLTVPDVLRSISNQRERFSRDFQEVLERARDSFVRDVDGPELEALWAAVTEAVVLRTNRSTGRTVRIRYQLFLQEDELTRADPFLVASRSAVAGRGSVDFAILEEPFEGFPVLVMAATDRSTATIARLLLQSALVDVLPDYKQSSVQSAVEQGVLLFLRNDNATWELATTRPKQGEVRVLVRRGLLGDFQKSLANVKLVVRPSIHDGWYDAGPIDAAELARVSGGALAAVRCLQATTVGAQITVVGGIRIDDGFLGTAGLLPSVCCSGASGIALVSRERTNGIEAGQVIQLERDSEGVIRFRIASDRDLVGRFELLATREGEVIASRAVTFRARTISHDFSVVTEPGRWLVEEASGDMLPADIGTDSFLGNEQLGEGVIDHAPQVSSGESASIDANPRFDQFVEAVAALALQRKGLGEFEIISLLSSASDLTDQLQVWSVLRAWVEAGYFDVLTRRRWRGRMYFARRPRLVVAAQGESLRIVLHGLAPYRLRVAAERQFRNLGAQQDGLVAVSAFVGAPQAWRVGSVASARAASTALGLGPLEWVRAPGSLVGSFDTIATSELGTLAGYKLDRVWDWERGGFRRQAAQATEALVNIEWHSRPDRPDLYLVSSAARSWATYARNWALLVGHRWAGRRYFELADSDRLGVPASFGPYVPIPVARSIGLRSGIMSGPVEQSGMPRRHIYQCVSQAERDWLAQWLWGGASHAVGQRFTWLLSSTNGASRRADVQPLPHDLQRRLREMNEYPAALMLAERLVPRRVVPHIRRALDLAGV